MRVHATTRKQQLFLLRAWLFVRIRTNRLWAIRPDPNNPIAYTSYIGYLAVHMLYDKSIKFVLITHHETFGCVLDVIPFQCLILLPQTLKNLGVMTVCFGIIDLTG